MKDQLLNTKGAAEWMGCTENWIHKLVYSGKIKAHIYDEHGVLVEREPNTPRQGQGLYFYEKDLKAYKGRKPGRPAGSKDKRRRKKALDMVTSADVQDKRKKVEDDTAPRPVVRKEPQS